MFLKTLAKLVKFTVEKKIVFFLVEKPTKVVEKNQCLGPFITCCHIGKLKEKKKKQTLTQIPTKV
jgi:hypothetical protein